MKGEFVLGRKLRAGGDAPGRYGGAKLIGHALVERRPPARQRAENRCTDPLRPLERRYRVGLPHELPPHDSDQMPAFEDGGAPGM